MAGQTSEAPNVERPMITNTTILILSSYVVGLASGLYGRGMAHPGALAAGMIGMICFVGLDLAAEKRRRDQIVNGVQELTDRLRRHSPAQLSATNA